MDAENAILNIGAIAGFIALIWKLFETYASRSSNTVDDKIVDAVNNVLKPLVRALENNTEATHKNTAVTGNDNG